jgi:hypothetical protein
MVAVSAPAGRHAHHRASAHRSARGVKDLVRLGSLNPLIGMSGSYFSGFSTI